ncbi:hypothetical protein GALMADRAFT_60427 [Galerina marginata CBS 339.88]|uniref:DDE Tnp4 domain-containing protein n=1 Tax=Galerina marginata (strain CBS 339.88) TaxID=685588 RepID=A0A067TN11_GALM3|nr:hypothetical protein GALMADRAFT_60427 [Galerina marginata CBS 339.88]
MPNRTDRQLAADALHRAFLVNFIAELESRELDYSSDSEGEDSDDSDDSDDSMDSSDSSATSSSSESSSDDDSDFMTPAETYVHHMGNLYHQRYMAERTEIPKTQALMQFLLGDYKDRFPHIFRSYLRIDPDCFDSLVDAIHDDDIFHNNSNNSQMPVDEQVAIALYRFGHYGNAASIMKVALQFGVGFGTVHLVTTRVLKACCSERFRSSSVQWASERIKAEAKDWVEKNSCPAWRNGWLMVDGTLVPLFRRPGYFGNVFFDRKSNYSLNVQLVSMPNCDIVDYSVGLPGSQHDASAWEETRTYQQHEQLLANDEWVWADSAYPLKTWCQSPYKK